MSDEREKNAAASPPSSYHSDAPTAAGGRGFAKGNPGRPPGIKNTRSYRKESMFQLFEFGERANTRKGKAALRPRIERIKALLNSSSDAIKMEAERFVWEADYGKAKQTVDVFHQSKLVEEARDKMRDFVESGGLHAVPDLKEQKAS